MTACSTSETGVRAAPRPPAGLIGAGLFFWGWESGLLLPALLLAVVIESARWVRARWDFTDQDFSRIWTFCTLALIATAVWAFTNQGLADFKGLFENPSLYNQRNAGVAGARTVATILRALPLTFFLFLAAQYYSNRQGVPAQTVSLILRWRWKQARRDGESPPPRRDIDLSYYYFGICLFAAGLRRPGGVDYFWGLVALLGWCFWWVRPRRFSGLTWAAVFLAALGLGYAGQAGLSQFQRVFDTYNPQWLSLFSRRGFDPYRTKTSLGSLAQRKLSAAVVIRLSMLSGAPPERLREASYRHFRRGSWAADFPANSFERVESDADLTSWLLLPGKTNSSVARVGCYLPGGSGLLPLPEGTGLLEHFPAYILQKNPMGAVMADGPGVVVFDALYGPGRTLDSVATNEDLSLPHYGGLALEETITELNLEGASLDEAIAALTTYFRDHFTYTTDPRAGYLRSVNESPISFFLRKSHRGHCEYFATATVLLLRQLGFPARYAVGYYVHEGRGGDFIIRERDAHAWCLVWDAAKGQWRDVDTTPASWLKADEMQLAWAQPVRDFFSRVWFEISRFRWGQTNLRKYLLWIFGPLLAILLWQILFQRRQRAPTRAASARRGDRWPGLDSELYELEQALAARVGPRQPAEALPAWLRQAGTVLARPAVDWDRLIRLHNRYRFDPRGLDATQRNELREGALEAVAALRHTKDL